MTSRIVNAAETWEKLYEVSRNINFASYDFDTVRQSLIEYLKVYYPENFNDFIDSSELILLINTFALACEMMAYRVDMASHENSIFDSSRKQSILKLTRFISYNATRNLPARGLVKLTSISTSEVVYDSQGNNLSNRVIRWADDNNPLWKEQFFTVMNRVLRNQYGQPIKAYNVNNVEFQLYEFNNKDASFLNRVHPYSVSVNGENISMEIVSSDLDSDGVYEKSIDGNKSMNILYSNDGMGDESDFTGFMMYTKQGSLGRNEYTFDSPIPGRSVEIDKSNINDVDVWVNEIDHDGNIIDQWTRVDPVNGQNIVFNTVETRKKYEIETLEDDNIRIVFGDGDFSDIPVGKFEIWTRQSHNSDVVINKNLVIDKRSTFKYSTTHNVDETCNLTFSLVSTLQNSTASEDIEHIRKNAPRTYYSQGRMVNAEDHNSLPLKDSSILKLYAVNRTFAGQPRYVDWVDGSGSYQNVKIFGDDLRIYYEFSETSLTTGVSGRRLIDDVIEPLIASPSIQNMLTYAKSTNNDIKNVNYAGRNTFFENTDQGLEKTNIQGVIDRHYYGEADRYQIIDGVNYAVVDGDPDRRIYQDNIPRIVDGEVYLNGATSGLQPIASEPLFGLRFNPISSPIGDGSINVYALPTEKYSIECIDTNTFVVYNSQGENRGTATTGVEFTDGNLTFTIVDGSIPFAIGDLLIVDSTGTSQTNINGSWEIIHGVDINLDGDYDISTAGSESDSSWLIWVQRNEDILGNIIDWTVAHRDLKIIAESPTTKFWVNTSDTIVDPVSGNRVFDNIGVLKSNLDVSRTKAHGSTDEYAVIANVTDDNGRVNPNKVEVYPSSDVNVTASDDLSADRHLMFNQFVNIDSDYVYFRKIDDFQNEAILAGDLPSDITWNGETSTDGLYFRRIGRDDLDFKWQHFSPNSNAIDIATSNINDIYVLTRGYYNSVKDYAQGNINYKPIPPTSLELRNTYRSLLKSKMMSDTIVMHSGEIKLLFGSLANPKMRAKFRVIKSPTAKLSDDQIKTAIVRIIEDYFDIDNWDFGETFYVTELTTKIHQELSTEIASVVLVPTYVNNSFGSLFIIESDKDEILQAALTNDDVEIVESYNPTILRQNK